MMSVPLTVTHYTRDKRPGNYSIEEIFRNVRLALGNKDVRFSEFVSKGKFDIRSVIKSIFFQGRVNHITGDINYYALFLNPRKTVLTVHDIGFYEKRRVAGLKMAIYKLLWMDIPFRRVKLITTVSHFTKDRIVKQFSVDESKVIVIHNPIDSRFVFAPRVVNPRLTILHVGTAGHKNLTGLIHAVKGLDCRLIVIGTPTKYQIALMSDYGVDHIILKNLLVEELYQQYVNCDVLYFASFYEGFGMPIIEAQATGRPVITSDFGAMKEVAGDAALFVDPSSTEQIRDAILRLREDDRLYEELVVRGLKNRERFCLCTIADKYLEVYQALERLQKQTD